jgi:hypothetical protein
MWARSATVAMSSNASSGRPSLYVFNIYRQQVHCSKNK